jgi:SNF2 family DNA or RNA helicase
MSMFERIRNMQKATADKKNAIKKQSITSQWVPEPDNETYLEAVMSSITPSASTPAPQVHEDEMVDRRALAEFQREQRRYNELKRKNGGKLTFRQDVEWLKIKGAETARKKKHARDLAKAMADAEGDTELFPEAHTSRDADKGDGGNESDDAFNFDSSGPSRKRQRRDMPRKEPKQLSMQEAELQSMQVALEATDDLPKKNRKSQPTDDDSQDTRANAKGKGSKARVKATKAKTASKPAAKGPRKTMKARRETDRAVKMTTSLFNADVFEQQAGNDAREQPTFRSRNKQDALKELIASVPLDERKQVRSDMGVLLAATKDFDGYGSVKAAGGNWLVKGMSTSLKGYQVMGSAFMRRRENAMEQPRGGLMADQMGLGKTLMMLANIVNGQPPRGQQPRTTLLVASPALLTQWGKEIDQHTKCGLGVMRYGSGNRLDSNHAFDILKGHDIILTTYGEVMKSYPKNEPPIECQTAEQKIAWWKNQFETQRGVLHRMRFLRIVLDEAQAIKNHMGRTSISCRALMADHKWALSGTPILNSLTELYPYFKFLGVPHTGSFKIFKHNYCDTNDVENTERLLVRLSQFMIRRTHADMMFNAPILKLPQADQATYWCEFNPVERCIYDIVHQRFAKNINLWQAKDELEKCYSNALVMLLRLRQLTAHILMLQFVMRDLLEVEDIARIKEVVNEASADSTTRSGRTIVALRRQLEKHAIEEKKRAAAVAKAKAEAQAAGRAYVEVQDEDVIEEVESQERDEPSGQPTAQEGASLGGSGEEFGKTFNFKPYLKSLKTGEGWDKAKKRAKCSYCGKPPKNPWITSCGHLICEVPCMEQSDLAAAEVEKVHSPCKACGQTPVSVQPCEFEEEPPETMAGATRSKAAKKPAKQRERRDREDISADWLSLAGAEVLPSAKTLAIKAQILNWTREDPKVKIIIYTQFLAM